MQALAALRLAQSSGLNLVIFILTPYQNLSEPHDIQEILAGKRATYCYVEILRYLGKRVPSRISDLRWVTTQKLADRAHISK